MLWFEMFQPPKWSHCPGQQEWGWKQEDFGRQSKLGATGKWRKAYFGLKFNPNILFSEIHQEFTKWRVQKLVIQKKVLMHVKMNQGYSRSMVALLPQTLDKCSLFTTMGDTINHHLSVVPSKIGAIGNSCPYAAKCIFICERCKERIIIFKRLPSWSWIQTGRTAASTFEQDLNCIIYLKINLNYLHCKVSTLILENFFLSNAI